MSEEIITKELSTALLDISVKVAAELRTAEAELGIRLKVAKTEFVGDKLLIHFKPVVDEHNKLILIPPEGPL